MGKIYKLSEICEIRAGYKQGLNDPLYWENGTIPYYRAGDIESQTTNPSKKLNKYAIEKLKITLTTNNSLLFSAIGTIGSIFYSRKPGLAYAGTALCLEPKTDLVIPNYLYYLLLSSKEKFKQMKTGSTIPMLSINSFSSVDITLPSLSEQKQILTKFQIVYNKLFQSEVIYNDFLLKLMKKYLELGDLLFQKYQDSKIKLKTIFN